MSCVDKIPDDQTSEDVHDEGEFDSRDFGTTPRSVDDEPELLDEMLEAFTFYDEDGDGLISTRDVGKVMRALGHKPTLCDETDIVAQFAIERCNDVDFRAFKTIMKKWVGSSYEEHYELMEAFRKFDKEENKVLEVETLRTMLTTMGEPLTNAEVDLWLGDAEEFIEDGQLKYEDFATVMLSK